MEAALDAKPNRTGLNGETGGTRMGAQADGKVQGESDATRQRVELPNQVSKTSHARDDWRGAEMDQDVHPCPEHHSFVERQTQSASERGSEFLFHATILNKALGSERRDAERHGLDSIP